MIMIVFIIVIYIIDNLKYLADFIEILYALFAFIFLSRPRKPVLLFLVKKSNSHHLVERE